MLLRKLRYVLRLRDGSGWSPDVKIVPAPILTARVCPQYILTESTWIDSHLEQLRRCITCKLRDVERSMRCPR